MEDCIEALFSSMAEKFNGETATKAIIRAKTSGGRAKVLNLKKDPTTKWRSLKRNTHAKKQGPKYQKKLAERMEIATQLNNGAASSDDETISKKITTDRKALDRIEKDNDVRAQGHQVVVERADSSGTSGGNNSDQQPKEKSYRDVDVQVDSEDANSFDRSPSKARDSSEGRRLRRSRPPESEELSQEMNAGIGTSENAEEKTPKRRGRSKKTVPLDSGEKSIDIADISGGSVESRLQRKRKQTIDADLEMNKADEDGEDATIADDVSEKGKKTRRSVRLEHRYEPKLDAQRSDDEEKNDSPPPSPTPPSEQSITPTLVIASPSVQLRKLEDEKTPPKKRGRRAKAQTTEKQTPESVSTALTDLSPSSSGSAIKKRPVSKDNQIDAVPVVIPKRSQRRIKPTSKILENIELGFDYDMNHSRITSCMGNEVETVPVPAVKTTSSRSSSRQRDVKSDHSHESQAQVKKKLFVKTDVYRERPTKPCPDFQLFFTEVKAAKWHHNKSPEDKKLSKKQLHKLLKQKHRHMQRLGLQRADSAEASDLENSSDDNEEFIPSKRVQVGKTNVTLRGRNSKESTPPVIRASTPKSTSMSISKKQRKKTLAPAKSKEKSNESAAENSESKVPSSSTLGPDSCHKVNSKDLICSCEKPSQYYTQKTPETSFCCAVDHIEEQKVGCCNQLSDNLLNLLRPSIRVGYMILCDDHTKRFKAHNCCATCGIFCTQGKFSFCKQQHFFHPECAQKFILNSPHDPDTPENYTSPTLVLKCPHCGIDTPERTSTVTMKCRSLPVFLPSQKPSTKAAKMGMPIVQIPVPANNNNSKSTKSSGVRKTMSLETLIPESVMNVVGRTNGRRTNCEFTPEDMYYAIKNDDLERVAEILGSGYDVTSCMSEFLDGTCLHLVAHLGSLQMAYLLLCKEFPQDFVNMVDRKLRTASMCAVSSDKCDILHLFTQCGADLNAKGPEGKTCLHIAAKLGNLKAIQILVESYRSSRSVSCFSKFINAQDDGGWTAMVWAAEHGRTEIVSFLLNHGAEADICDNDNNTVLHWATLNKDSLDTINLLLQAGTDCNIQNVDGDTPLHIACRNSTTRLCLALIENGADLMIKNKAEQLPYDCIPREDSQCARTVGFNMHMRSFMPTGLRNRIVSSDISNGREQRPIQAVRNENNMMNSASGAGAVTSSSSSDESDEMMLPDFRYITKTIIQQNPVQIDQRVSQMRICSCRDGCVSDQCQCTAASVRNWYTAEGRLNSDFSYEDPPVIFECNDVCGCNKLVCKNRIVQNGVKIPLQVTECDEQAKGWGVRSLVNIPKGSFVAEYTGEILTDFEADRRTDDSYFFDLGHDHCIDANYYGNVSRFFNHSCEPNLVPVRVFFEHQDFRFPKIALFACKNISVGEEMCFDYGDKFWMVKQRYFTCKCLTNVCKYSSTNKKTPSHSSKQQEQQQQQPQQPQENHTKPEQTQTSISLSNGSDH